MVELGGARYGQIAAELRERIHAGELAPGDPVPSTREITRQWNVAMATATKVLTLLRHEGLVRAVPGVGTVVETGRASARGGRADAAHRRPAENGLGTERIIATAVAIADGEGLAAVSMRRVAAELGVGPMSLYRHVADKDDLLLQMMDHALTGWSAPEGPQGWRDRLEHAARALWVVLRRHPWLASALSITRPQPVASGIPFTEFVLATLDAQGLDLATTYTVHITLFNYIRGTAINVETEAEAEALSGLDKEEWLDTQQATLEAIFATGRYPTLERLTRARHDIGLDELFEFGLHRLLDGIANLLEERAPRRTHRNLARPDD
jgi:AcrR family transcriptional regulator